MLHIGRGLWQCCLAVRDMGRMGKVRSVETAPSSNDTLQHLLTGISVTAVFFDQKSTDQNPCFRRGIVPEFSSAGVRGISGDCMTILVYTTFPVCWIPRDDFLFVLSTPGMLDQVPWPRIVLSLRTLRPRPHLAVALLQLQRIDPNKVSRDLMEVSCLLLRMLQR
jgi:hypothetical protein